MSCLVLAGVGTYEQLEGDEISARAAHKGKLDMTELNFRVRARRNAADSICSFELELIGTEQLPTFSAGARFEQTGASHSILVAGGIGVTPILAMARQLHRGGDSFEMHYCARSRERMAFHD